MEENVGAEIICGNDTQFAAIFICENICGTSAKSSKILGFVI
jgi:hypothetical protein